MKNILILLMILLGSCNTKKEVLKFHSLTLDPICDEMEIKANKREKIKKSYSKLMDNFSQNNSRNLNQKVSDSLENIAFNSHLTKKQYQKYKEGRKDILLAAAAEDYKNMPRPNISHLNEGINFLRKQTEDNLKYYYPKMKQLRIKFDDEITKEDKEEIESLRNYYNGNIDELERTYIAMFSQLENEEKQKRLESAELLIIQFRNHISNDKLEGLTMGDTNFSKRIKKIYEKYVPQMKEHEHEAYNIWESYQKNIGNEVVELPKEKQRMRLGYSFILRDIK